MKHNPKDYHDGFGVGNDLRRIGVDLDGTLAESIWPKPGIGKPIMKTVEWCRKMSAEGYKIIIYTSRADHEYKDIAKWCKTYGVPFVWIYTGKPLLKFYVDDRALRPEEL